MKPETSLPNNIPERAPDGYSQAVELAPQYQTPETGIETGPDRHEQIAEATAAAADNTGLPTALPPATIAPLQPNSADKAVNDVPLVAGDDDLIEKEWVDRAKKIVDETKEDPYRREEAVNQLQRDYQKKRYGRELGEA